MALTPIWGCNYGSYIIQLHYDGSMHHYIIRQGCKVIHHFFDEFDTEQDARDWCASLVKEHLDQIEEGTLWHDQP